VKPSPFLSPTLRPHYRPDIDGLRALAVVSVMIYHLNSLWLPGGFVGVDVFFVISGFVVTSSLSQSATTSFAQFISQFYARRLARIMPALLFVLLSTIVAATLFIPHAWLSQLSEETARFAFMGLSNFTLQNNPDSYFAPRTEYNPYAHTWSLGVEEQFYLIAPLLVYFWLRATALAKGTSTAAHARVRAIISIIAIALFASLVWCIWTSANLPRMAFYSISTRFWELGSGALLFILTSRPSWQVFPIRCSKLLQSSGAPLGLLLVIASFLFASGKHFPWPWALMPVVGTLLMIGGAQVNASDRTRRILGIPWMTWIGKRSYSLYLWHWPVYVLFRWTIGLENIGYCLLALLITVLLSMFSYRYIEQPLRHNSWLEKRPALLTIALFVLATAACYAVASTVFSQAQKLSLSTVMKNGNDWYRNGLSQYPGMTPYECLPTRQTQAIATGQMMSLTPKKACAPQGISSQQIFVLGDSHADALFPVFEELSAQSVSRIFIYANAGCSFIDFRTPMNQSKSADCDVAPFNATVSADVLAKAQPGDLVILPSLRMERYTDQWENFGIRNMQEKMGSPYNQALRKAATQDAITWLEPFAKHHLKIVLIAPPPIFQSPSFRCADWFNRNHPICKAGLTMPKAELGVLRQPVLDQIQTLQQTLPKIYSWDPFAMLCPSDTCQAIQNGRPLFFDGDHLSNYGNGQLYQPFYQWLQDERLLHRN